MTALLLLHGGPGMPSDALEPLEDLARTGRTVVAYDQIGCGRSDRPRDSSLWTVDTFLDELAEVRAALGLTPVHILGWSWGGILALEHVLRQPAGVASLTLASTPPSAALWTTEVHRLRDQLPEQVKVAMRRYEEGYRPRAHKCRRTTRPGVSTSRAQVIAVIARAGFGVLCRSPVVRAALWASAIPGLRRVGYEVANAEYIRRHVMLGDPRDAPLCVFRSFAGMNRDVYQTMWGPSEYFPTGRLKDWDVTPRLREIRVPTLITSGRHDEATPAQMRVLRDGIPDSRWVVFEHSAHGAIVEEPERYRAVLESFLQSVEDNLEEGPVPARRYRQNACFANGEEE